MNIGLTSYSSAAIFYLILLLLLLTNWRGRLQGALLVGTVAVSFFWAVSAAYVAGKTGSGMIAYKALEVLRCALWFVFLLRLLDPLKSVEQVSGGGLRYATSGILVLASLVLLLEVFSTDLSANVLPPVGVDILILGHLVLAVIGLALIEQLFRNTRPEQRWAVKYLFFGLGALFMYDFFLYSDALLFKRLDTRLWEARGFVNLLVVPLVAVSAARNPEWSSGVFVSRRLVFHTAALLGAGFYLLTMAAVGYYIRAYGGAWGTAAQVVFLFLAALVLLTLLFSGQMRARMRIFMSKHFFNYKFDYRDEWLQLSRTLAEKDEGADVKQRAIRALANIVDSPSGVLWTVDEQGNFTYRTHWNMSEPMPEEIEPGTPLIQFLKQRQWIIDLDELTQEPETYEGLVVPAWLSRVDRAHLVVPLIQNEELSAFIILAKPRAPWPMNWETRDLIKTVGLQVANYLALLETTEALVNARQFEAFNRLSSYLVHDLKNLSSQLSMVVANAQHHKANPAFIDDAFKTIENSSRKLDRMLAQLRKGGEQESTKVIVDVEKLLKEVCRGRSNTLPRPGIDVVDGNLLILVNRDQLANVLSHLIQNAQEATPREGKITTRAYQQQDHVVIEIADDGCGMSENFIRQRLFRPFDTSKGNAGMGIGVYQSREIVRTHGGDMSVKSEEGGGSVFRVRLPLYKCIPQDAEPVRIIEDRGKIKVSQSRVQI